MPFPYKIILGRDTALPWTLDNSGYTGIALKLPIVKSAGLEANQKSG